MLSPEPAELWRFLPWGYALTVMFELPVLWFGLSPRHSMLRRLLAACWLTACTYPVVVLVLPLTIEPKWGRTAYVVGAELFAPLAESLLFLLAFRPAPNDRNAWADLRDIAAICAANLVSFLVGGWLAETC